MYNPEIYDRVSNEHYGSVVYREWYGMWYGMDRGNTESDISSSKIIQNGTENISQYSARKRFGQF